MGRWVPRSARAAKGSLDLEAEHLAAEKQERADGLVLGTGRDALCTSEMSGVVAHGSGIDAWPRQALAVSEVVEEAARPVGVARLGAVRIVPSAEALPELLESGQLRHRCVDDGTRRGTVPVGALEEVDEVEAEGVLGLVDLPLLRSRALEVLAESAYPIDQGLVCRRA